MLQRVIYEDWQMIFPIVAFAAAAAIYTLLVWRAVHMKHGQLDRLSRLPLEEEAPNPDRHE